MTHILVIASLLLVTSPALADSIGPCPEGQVVVMNPTEEGAMHHSGFHCDPDPNASHCSASPAADGGALALVSVAIVAIAIARRR